MRIGIDIRNIGKYRTGDEVVFFNLVKNFALLDEKNEYQLFTDKEDKETQGKISRDLGINEKNNFQIISLPTRSKFIWNFWTLPRYLNARPVDIYLTQYITPFFVSRKTKIATIIHDISFNVYPKMIKKSDLFFLKTLIPISLRRADKIIAVSQFTRSEIIHYYKLLPEKIDWIHNAVSEDFKNQNISPERIKFIRTKYKLPEKYILYIGTLQPRKNIPILIEAYAHQKAEFSGQGVKLVIAGGKGHNYDARIDETVQKHKLEDSVIFPGFIDEEDKAAFLAGAQIFCFPSLYEGFGIPILEAMSMGTPVVASDIVPHQEIAGQAALFFNPRDGRELSQKISEILSDKASRGNLINRGREQSRRFSWEKTARKMKEILEKSVSRSD